MNTTSTFNDAIKQFEEAMINTYTINPETGEPLELTDDQFDDIDKSAKFATEILKEQLAPFVQSLQAQITALELSLAASHTNAPAPSDSFHTIAPGKTVPYNPKAHNAYQAFVAMNKKTPDKRLSDKLKANGDWSKTVGALWKELYTNDAMKNEYFMKYREIVWPNVDFGSKSLNKQSRSGYNFFQMSQKGKNLSSSDISAQWKALSDEQKRPFNELAAREKRGEMVTVPVGMAVPVPLASTSTSSIVAATASSAMSGYKPGSSAFTVFQKEQSGKGLSQKEIGTAWKNLPDDKKKEYAERLKTNTIVA